ncbi:SLC13 family permease [Sabulicella glaciei]|uniref:SLC13 family permease n=1 Tax=Sabulicella glaciei TaxID=2984948 RepID=A0ABT3NWP9_9PROT|nr:SLC13 family permease [Roseococcus sp. MDT2-1-1]MCW8086586.1 SLC13 family permease [Roseococcus sp. MDT2-1-1]
MSEQLRQQGEYEEYTEAAAPGGRSATLIWSLRAFGLAAALLVWLAMGSAEGLSSDARWVAAVATLMAVWWMTEAVPLSATSLLPIVLLPMLTQRTVAQATAPYASSIVFLFLGGFLIAIAMEKWNLHRRIALLTLRRVGVEPKRIVLGLMLSTGFLSMWVSNTATTLMMLPIGLSVLALVTERSSETTDVAGHEPHRPGHVDFIADKNIRRFGTCLLLAIAWSATMGGLGTLLGSPPMPSSLAMLPPNSAAGSVFSTE